MTNHFLNFMYPLIWILLSLELFSTVPVDNTSEVLTINLNSSENKGFVSNIIDNIVNLGSKSKCATNEGRPGYCQLTPCYTNGNFSASKCPGRWLNCCPSEQSFERFPPAVSECGIRPVKKSDLIVGGEEAVPHTWPWAIALYRVRGDRQFFQCGGSIISNQYILTAAHCVYNDYKIVPENYVVKVGAHDLTNSGEFIQIEAIEVHENYRSNYHNDDIALLKLKKTLDFSKNNKIFPVCLPKPDSTLGQIVGTRPTMVGWGVLNQGDFTPSNKLYQIQVPIYDRNECRKNYQRLVGKNDHMNWNNVVCAAERNGGKDTCQGDSGGSMTMSENKKYYQIGVVSFGYGCAVKNYPGVYTYVPKYLSWIGSHMK